MKTLIFSIYISRCSVYQWEVRMFSNSLLTWSLGQATHKCCLAGVGIGHRGTLRAIRSWLHCRAHLARDTPGHRDPTPGSFAVHCSGVTSIPTATSNKRMGLPPPLLRLQPAVHTCAQRRTLRPFALEPVMPQRRARVLINSASQAVEQRAGFI